MAAVAGGALWAFIIIFAELEIGIIAWGIGGLSGFLVLLCSRGRKGVSQQVIAVVSSLIAITAGKYFALYYFFKQAVAAELGQRAASDLSLFSAEVIDVVLQNIALVLSAYDILWIGLAVVTAWKIPATRFSYFRGQQAA